MRKGTATTAVAARDNVVRVGSGTVSRSPPSNQVSAFRLSLGWNAVPNNAFAAASPVAKAAPASSIAAMSR
ncbi:MAG: hypothetical protein ACREPY_17430 [Rhodanobacteraceae bacterium]